MILSTAYLPNIQYFHKLTQCGVTIEAHENFQKQSFRNRAQIMTAGGVHTLTVPVMWNHNSKMPIQDVLIDNSAAWQRTHWRAIRSAYAASPYFDHYAHRLEPFYKTQHIYLWELNRGLTAELLNIFGFSDQIPGTGEYVVEVENDFRNSISPHPRLQQPDVTFTAPYYYQVFSDRLPFAPNLSIIDYLFCEGATLNICH